MKKLKKELFATDMAIWRKKGIFGILIFLSLLPFFLVVLSSDHQDLSQIWALRHFVGLAVFQAVAQISLGLYILNHNVPNYVIYCVVFMALFSQTTFGIAVTLISIV